MILHRDYTCIVMDSRLDTVERLYMYCYEFTQEHKFEQIITQQAFIKYSETSLNRPHMEIITQQAFIKYSETSLNRPHMEIPLHRPYNTYHYLKD